MNRRDETTGGHGDTEVGGAASAGAASPRPASAPAGPNESQPRRGWPIALGTVAVVAALIVLGRYLPVAEWIEASRGRLAELGALGPVLFGLVYVVAALLFVPGAVITLAAGTLFGPWLGTAVVSVASTCAAALAFLLARSVLRERVEAWAAARPKFAALDGAIRREGWRVVGLLRLSPAMPFSLGNYLFGLTPVAFGPYVLVSWLAMLPGTFLYVSLGAAGASAASGETEVWRMVLLGVGIVASVLVTVLLGRAAKRRLSAAEAHRLPP